jgi:hypothetical protein
MMLALRVIFAKVYAYQDNIIVKKGKDKSPLELMFKEKAKELKRLRKFGGICVAATKAKIQANLNDRGTVCVFVGYPNMHAKNVYGLINLKTNHIIKSRDVILSKKVMENV